jgi:hypothetical protein
MKKHTERWLPALLAVGALTLTSCTGVIDEAAAGSGAVEPATVEPVDGSQVHRITLTELAAKRLGIKTAQVQEGFASSGRRLATGRAAPAYHTSIPYSAVIYDATGQAWTYTSPKPLVFVRARIVVDRTVGNVALLEAGPAPGTTVVTVGAPELWGTEYEVGE